MTIILVLPRVPGYSETFFQNKIRFLSSEGYKIIVVGANPSRITFDGASIIEPLAFEGGITFNSFISMVRALFHILFSLTKSYRFIQLEIETGRSKKEAVKNLFINANLLRLSADWVHFGYATMALGRENLASIIGARMAVSLRGFDISIYPLKHPGCYNLLWKRCDKVHTISDDLVAHARIFGLDDMSKVTKISPAIDADTFFFNRNEEPFPTPLRILSIGRLHWKKGFEYTIASLALLAQKGIDFQYTLIGKGNDLERLVLAAHQLGISDRIKFVGSVPHSEVPAILQQNDVYVQFSLQEGFCNAVLEAQCNGLLCVVSDAEGLSENVIHQQTGFVVARRQTELLAQKLAEVAIMSGSQKIKMVGAAQQRVKAEFDLVQQKEKFLMFYQN